MAHLDHLTAINEHPTPLQELKYRTVQSAIYRLEDFLGKFSEHYKLAIRCDFDTETSDLDADRLLSRLRASLEADSL